jgi:hypothetical protein
VTEAIVANLATIDIEQVQENCSHYGYNLIQGSERQAQGDAPIWRKLKTAKFAETSTGNRCR